MNLIFEKYTQILTAAQRLQVQIAGNFFRLSVAPYPVTVSLISNSRIIGTMAGMLAGDYVKDIEFDGVVIVNGATDQSISYQIAGGGAGSDRVLGEVSVINGEVASVKAGRCFMGFAGGAGVAGQLMHAQIWNPLGSGVELIVSKISVIAGVQQSIGINTFGFALTNGSSTKRNKSSLLANPKAALCYGAYAAMQGTQFGNFATSSTMENVDFEFSEPIVVVPGRGILTFASIVNTWMYTTFQWEEVAQ